MKRNLIPILLSLTFLVVGIITLSDYGINWDAPVQMLRGQAFAHYFLTGKTSYEIPPRTSPFLVNPDQYASRYYLIPIEYLPETNKKSPVVLPDRPLLRAEFEIQLKQLNKRVSFYQHEDWNGAYSIANDGPGHLPLVDITSALSNRLFFGRLGVLGDIESYQLVYVAISTLGILLVSLFTLELTGSIVASLVAGLSLFFFPIFFAESHINMKDPAQAVFFTGSVWAFRHWVKENRKRWFVLFTLFVSFALGVKWNIVFLPFILLPWLFLIRNNDEFKRWFVPKKLVIYGMLFSAFCFLFLVLIWPYAWSNPIARIFDLFGFYMDMGIKQVSAFQFEDSAIVRLISRTPEIILFLVALGCYHIVRSQRKDRPETYLLLFWVLVTVIRVSLPMTWSIKEPRQIMEIIPAMAILSGIGAVYLMNRIKNLEFRIKFFKTYAFEALFIILYSLFLLIPILRLHPYENAYSNILAGGVKGAAQKGLIDWNVTFGSIYKQAVTWLNDHAEKDANIAHIDGSMFAISPLWLRRDISISPYHFSGLEKKGEYILKLYDRTDHDVFAYRYPARFLKPLHEITVDGFPLLTIYKNDSDHLIPEFTREEHSMEVWAERYDAEEKPLWRLDLGNTYPVTRIVAPVEGKDCSYWQNRNESFIFNTSDQTGKTIRRAFVWNEKIEKEPGRIEYSFPAEKAHSIDIDITNSRSCLRRDRPYVVYYLDQ